MNRNRRTREKGDVTVEALILFPLLLTFLFAIVQMSVIWFARGSLENAATDALFQYQTSSEDKGAAAAAEIEAIRLEQKLVQDITLLPPTTLGRGIVQIRVTGWVQGPFPGSRVNIGGSATGPIDGFRPKGEPAP